MVEMQRQEKERLELEQKAESLRLEREASRKRKKEQEAEDKKKRVRQIEQTALQESSPGTIAAHITRHKMGTSPLGRFTANLDSPRCRILQKHLLGNGTDGGKILAQRVMKQEDGGEDFARSFAKNYRLSNGSVVAKL